MKRNIRFTLCYDGSRYHGWEKKQGQETIQGKMEAVLARMCENMQPEEIKLIAAGRTDAGVHAKGMVANCYLDTSLTPDQIKEYVNHYLPEDIAVTVAEEVDMRFHARYLARGKTYCYTCYVGKEKPVFDRKYVYVLDEEPDMEKMQRAADCLVGQHDFASFCTNAGKKKSTVRTVDTIAIRREGDYLKFIFHGDGFLYHMVRIMTGTLLAAGKGELLPEQVAEILKMKKREFAGATAPARGLCLLKIDY